MSTRARSIVHALTSHAARGALAAFALLPYRTRMRAGHWLGARLIGPALGQTRAVRENLALVCPELPPAEAAAIARGVCGNAMRGILELHAGDAFIARLDPSWLGGPGLAELRARHAAGGGAILVTGHFGSYDAARAALVASGIRVGSLYRPTANAHFNPHYVRAMERIGTPMFPRGRRGLADLVRFLRQGGVVAIVADQVMPQGVWLRFFGRPAFTALSAADMALKYGVPMFPVFGIRREDGDGFDLCVEEPIPPSDPETMMQAFNDRLEARVRSHMDQWMWMYRRWREPRGPARDGGTAD